MKLDNILDKFTSSDEKEEIYEENQLRKDVEEFIQSKDSEASQQEIEMKTETFLNRIETIVDEAIHTGKKQERMKGEDGNRVFNLLLVCAGGNAITVVILLAVHFGGV
jgi:hypothetical protein